MCLQTISKLLSQQKCTFVIFFADLKVRKYLFTRDTSIISARTSCQLIQNLKACVVSQPACRLEIHHFITFKKDLVQPSKSSKVPMCGLQILHVSIFLQLAVALNDIIRESIRKNYFICVFTILVTLESYFLGLVFLQITNYKCIS